MTNVELFRNGQRCNSVNYWVTQARPGQDSDQDRVGPGPGLTPANGVTGVRGRVRGEVLVGPPCRRLRQTGLCNPAAVFALSCGAWSPLSVSDSRNSPDTGRCQTGRGAAKARCREWQWPGPGLGQERMVVRAESCANSPNITVWSECQHHGHIQTTLPTSHAGCCTWSDQRHERHQPQVVITDIKRPLSPVTSVGAQWVCHERVVVTCDTAPPSLHWVLRPLGVGQVSR